MSLQYVKTCKKCNKRDLSWNKTWYDHSGKWQLVNHKNKDGDWCVNNIIKPKETKSTKKDYTICPLCIKTSFGYCKNDEYDYHKKLYHPNNETLSELDYIGNFMTAYTIKKFWKHDSHYAKYV